MRARTIDDDTLGSGQAAVLAALIRRASRGPARIPDLASDTGLRNATVRKHLERLHALDLVDHRDDCDPVPLVQPLTIEQAANQQPKEGTQ